jgi:hypothetical protein
MLATSRASKQKVYMSVKEFMKSKGLRPNGFFDRKQFNDLMEEYAKEKAIEFRMWDYYKIGMDVNELRKTCVEYFEEYEREKIKNSDK